MVRDEDKIYGEANPEDMIVCSSDLQSNRLVRATGNYEVATVSDNGLITSEGVLAIPSGSRLLTTSNDVCPTFFAWMNLSPMNWYAHSVNYSVEVASNGTTAAQYVTVSSDINLGNSVKISLGLFAGDFASLDHTLVIQVDDEEVHELYSNSLATWYYQISYINNRIYFWYQSSSVFNTIIIVYNIEEYKQGD